MALNLSKFKSDLKAALKTAQGKNQKDGVDSDTALGNLADELAEKNRRLHQDGDCFRYRGAGYRRICRTVKRAGVHNFNRVRVRESFMIAPDCRKWGSGECRNGFGVGHPASSLISF